MKIICNREKLNHAFLLAAMVVKAQSTKQILKNIKLEAFTTEAVLLATDMEVGIRVSLPEVEIQVPGCVVLPVDRFSAVLRESTSDEVILESEGTRTRILVGNSTYSFPTENPDNFPPISAFNADKYVKIPSRGLKEAIRRTIFSADAESGKQVFGGIQMLLEGSQLTLTGTDSRRLSTQSLTVEVKGEYADSLGVVVPVRSLQLIDRILSSTEEDVYFSPGEHNFYIKTSTVTFFSTLVEGRYPDWRRTLQAHITNNRYTVELMVGTFFSAVRQAAIVVTREMPAVELLLSNGKLVITANSPETGESRVELPVSYEEEELKIRLNPVFLTDFFRTQETESMCRLKLENSQRGALFETSENYHYLVMPLGGNG